MSIVRRALVVFLVACTLALPFTPGHAADFVVVTRVGGTAEDATDYVPGSDNLGVPVVVPAGSTLSYRNTDIGLPHDLVSATCVTPEGEHLADDFSTGGRCPGEATRLFAAEIPSGPALTRVATVVGVADLPAGTYVFYCSVHPGDGAVRGPMTGALVVV